VREGPGSISRGEFVFESQVHGSHGGRASVWRIQYVWNGLEDGRQRLFIAVSAGEDGRREGELREFPREPRKRPGVVGASFSASQRAAGAVDVQYASSYRAH